MKSYDEKQITNINVIWSFNYQYNEFFGYEGS